MAGFDTRSLGLFTQTRVGQYGQLFRIFKLRTYHKQNHQVSKFGDLLRRSKIDELPQLLNVLIGEMSFVGPRPDIPGYYDQLQGDDRLILNMKPGITSEASIKYKNEDAILSKKDNPLDYNDQVLFPDKVKINLDYYKKRSMSIDLKILKETLLLK